MEKYLKPLGCTRYKFSFALVNATYHTLFSSSLPRLSQLSFPMSVINTTLSASPPLLWCIVEIVILGLSVNFSPFLRQDLKYSRSSGGKPFSSLQQYAAEPVSIANSHHRSGLFRHNVHVYDSSSFHSRPTLNFLLLL